MGLEGCRQSRLLPAVCRTALVERSSKAISDGIGTCGRHGSLQVHRRISAAIRAVHPTSKEQVECSLGTAEVRFASMLARAEPTRIDAEVRRQRQEVGLGWADLTHQVTCRRGEAVEIDKVRVSAHSLHAAARDPT